MGSLGLRIRILGEPVSVYQRCLDRAHRGSGEGRLTVVQDDGD